MERGLRNWRESGGPRWLIAIALIVGCASTVATYWPTESEVALVIAAAAAVVAIIARRPRQHGPSAPAGALTGVALVALPIVLIEDTPTLAPSAWAAVTVIALAAALRLAWLAGRGEQRIAETIFWIFAYVFLGVAPIAQLRLHSDPSTTPSIYHSLDGATVAVIAIAMGCFSIGAAMYSRRAGAGLAEREPRRIHQGRLTLLSVLGILAAAYYIRAVGFGPLFASREQLGGRISQVWSNPTTAAIIGAAASMPLLVAFVALIQQRRHVPGSSLRGVVLPGVVLIALLAVVNPISGARFVFGTVALAILTVFGLTATRSRFRAFVVGTVAGLLLLFPIADAFRRAGGARVQFDPVSSLLTGDFDAFDQINNSLLYLGQNGSTDGKQALGVLLFWVPRSLWASKPTDTGVMLAHFRGYYFDNLSAPVEAELLVNGGWVAVVLGMLALGWLIRRWDDRTVAVLHDGHSPGILACILPFYMLILLRGSLLQATAMLATIVVCAWFVHDRRPVPETLGADRSAAPGRALISQPSPSSPCRFP